MPDAPGIEQAEVEATSAPAAAPVVADEVLLASVDLARRALLEVTAPETVGSVVGHVAEGEHVLTLLFASDLSGYPGWRWSVTIARVDDGEPTVLETELMPGEAALLAPEWVPWSERLAEYRAAQEAAAAAAREDAEAEGSADDELLDGDDFDDEDHDDLELEADGFEVDDEDLDDEDLDDEDLDDEDLDDDDDLDEDDLDDDSEGDDFGAGDSDDEFDGIDIDALDDSADEGDDGEDDDDLAQSDEPSA
ncbi:DUF3027 domain-containing protein [Agromyces sp. SYSU K20354]|uniref:DUF3027 domain-containing protein n=1 Tax=Agromyces cavernae TaxID=2898659 RepID=UPI001E5E4529|nr:DUF3027 domain-containing protein [Agromyces cavernae]MCD2444278.1 DUF3027 domain-containing protein [Agromyces cavernae]